MNSQTNRLAGKIDYLYAKIELLSGAAGAQSFLQEAGAKMSSMVQEFQSFAQKATLDGISRSTARSALKQFVATAEQLAGDASNVTQAATVLKQVASLHSALRSAAERRPKTSSMSGLLEQGVEYMQQSMQQQLATIGIYKHHSTQ